MTGDRLGRRFERLLFFTAPISLATLLVLGIALAADGQESLRTARCYVSVADLLSKNLELLNKAWRDLPPKTKSATWGFEYERQLNALLPGASLSSDCFSRMLYAELSKRADSSPPTIISKLRSDAESMRKGPLQYAGVQIPERTTLSLFGSSVSIDSLTFSTALQIALAPVLLVWLGSLYHTRFRESIVVGKAVDITDVYPHLVNVYVTQPFPVPRKKSWAVYYGPYVVIALYTMIRMGLTGLVVGPPVVAYLASLYYFHPADFGLGYYIAGATVALFAFAILVCEVLPWHVWKVFPKPPMARFR